MVRELSFRPLLEKGGQFCKHGNIAENCERCDTKPAVMGIEREDLSGGIQQARKKKNIRYEKDGEALFAKYVTRQATGLDNMAGLAREARLLQKTAATGIVPEVVDFKMYPNEQKARLLLKEIPGTSLDRMSLTERKRMVAEHGSELVAGSAQALQKIHELGVHVVDVNEGTFLFEEKDGGLTTRVLDFEIGYDEADGQEERERAARFLKKDDPAFVFEPSLPITDTVLTQSEMYRWATTMRFMVFPRMPFRLEVSDERRADYDNFFQRHEQQLQERAVREAKQVFASFVPGKDDRNLAKGEDGYLAEMVPKRLALLQRDYAVAYALPSILQENGCKLDVRTIDFLARCLSPDINERPTSFAEFLSSREEKLAA